MNAEFIDRLAQGLSAMGVPYRAPMLETLAGVEAGADLRAIDLAAAAREYILSTGLSTEEVDALYANLAKDYSAEY